eukprot:11189005-Lingulodinium_polyedra.AAC.1
MSQRTIHPGRGRPPRPPETRAPLHKWETRSQQTPSMPGPGPDGRALEWRQLSTTLRSGGTPQHAVPTALD